MAAKAGLENCRFEVASATEFPGDGYDLVTCFDCLHDLADPVGAAERVRQTLRPDGVWLIVEPFASDTPAENLTPVGRVFYGASTLICVPASQAGNGPALGRRPASTGWVRLLGKAASPASAVPPRRRST